MVTPVRDFLIVLEHLFWNPDMNSGEGQCNRRLANEDSNHIQINCQVLLLSQCHPHTRDEGAQKADVYAF